MTIGQIALFFKAVFQKTFVAVLALIVVFFLYGTVFVPGKDTGQWYVLVFTLPGMGVAIVCYILYFITDRITSSNKLNALKNFIHLILGIALFWLPHNETFAIFILILLIVLAVNLMTLLFSSIEKIQNG
jgi:MFS-type transporter involved in bile tolerance (Atg22 family)